MANVEPLGRLAPLGPDRREFAEDWWRNAEGRNDRTLHVTEQHLQREPEILAGAPSRTLREDFMQGKCVFHVHLGVRPRDREFPLSEYCAVYNWPTVISGFEPIHDSIAICLNSNAPRRPNEPFCDSDHPVLVPVREFLECPERIVHPIYAPAFIRLESAKRCPIVVAQRLPASLRFVEIPGLRTKREAGLFDQSSRVVEDSLLDEVIKGRPQGSDEITRDESEDDRRLPFYAHRESDMAFLSVTLTLKRETVRVTRVEGCKGVLQYAEVVICPVEFRLPTGDGISHEVNSDHEGSTDTEDPEGLRDSRPKRGDFDQMLTKSAKPPKKSAPRRPKK